MSPWFFQVTAPVISVILFTWWHDYLLDIKRRFDEVNKRLDRLEDRAGIYRP